MRTWNRLPFVAVVLALACGRTVRADEPKPDDDSATRGYLGYGVSFIQGLKPEERKEYGIEREKGLYVGSIGLGSPAAAAGLKPGDVIVALNGKAVPDASAVDPKDEKSKEAYFAGEWKAITHAVKPGDEVAIDVERKGEKQTVRAKAVSKATLDQLQKEAEEEAQAVKVPDPRKAGPSNAAGFSFEGLAEGVSLPPDVLGVTGYWSVEEEEGNASNHGLRQESDVGTDRALAVVTGDGRALADGTVSARIAPLKPTTSVGGGLALRVKDRLHYYAVVFDGVARTFRIAKVSKQESTTLATVEAPSPKLKSWHTIEAVMSGHKITATLDGGSRIEASDGAYDHGWAGLYTENDAATLFDDLKITPK